MSPPIPITWKIGEENLINAVYYSCKKIGHSIDRVQMNRRGLSESLDDKIMGDVATSSFYEYLISKNIPAIMYDQIRQDDFTEIDPGWDIACGPRVSEWVNTIGDPGQPEGLVTISVKSSRLPRYDTLERAVSIRDFKIFAYPGREIDDCITADLESQVYYDFYRTQLGNRKITLDSVIDTKQDKENAIEIIDALDVRERYAECSLTAWNSKEDIVRDSKKMRTRCWNSFGKMMWLAPLRNGKGMEEFEHIRF